MIDLVDEIVCPNRTLTHPALKLTWEQKHIHDYADTVDACLVSIYLEWQMSCLYLVYTFRLYFACVKMVHVFIIICLHF